MTSESLAVFNVCCQNSDVTVRYASVGNLNRPAVPHLFTFISGASGCRRATFSARSTAVKHKTHWKWPSATKASLRHSPIDRPTGVRSYGALALAHAGRQSGGNVMRGRTWVRQGGSLGLLQLFASYHRVTDRPTHFISPPPAKMLIRTLEYNNTIINMY